MISFWRINRYNWIQTVARRVNNGQQLSTRRWLSSMLTRTKDCVRSWRKHPSIIERSSASSGMQSSFCSWSCVSWQYHYLTSGFEVNQCWWFSIKMHWFIFFRCGFPLPIQFSRLAVHFNLKEYDGQANIVDSEQLKFAPEEYRMFTFTFDPKNDHVQRSLEVTRRLSWMIDRRADVHRLRSPQSP